MNFSIKDPQTADLVTFTEEILNGKLHFSAVKVLTLFICQSNQMMKLIVVAEDEGSGFRKFLLTESPLKMMKNDFLFLLKSYFCPQDI